MWEIDLCQSEHWNTGIQQHWSEIYWLLIASCKLPWPRYIFVSHFQVYPPSTLSGPSMAPLAFGITVIHTHCNYSILQDFFIEMNDCIASYCDHPMIGKHNYSHSTSSGPILAPLAFGVIVIHTHGNECVLSLLTSSLLTFLPLLYCCIWCLSHYILYPYTHSDKNCHGVAFTSMNHKMEQMAKLVAAIETTDLCVLYLLCKLLSLKWIIL